MNTSFEIIIKKEIQSGYRPFEKLRIWYIFYHVEPRNTTERVWKSKVGLTVFEFFLIVLQKD